MESFLIRFMEEQDYPNEAVDYFLSLNKRINEDEDLSQLMKSSIKDFYEDKISTHKLLEFCKTYAKQAGTHEYTLTQLFFMYCAKRLEERYIEECIDRNIYLATMNDLKCKLMECKEVYDIWGTFVGHWYPPFFKLERFALGRLQYEKIPFSEEDYTKKGFTVHKGSVVYNSHIPSSGPLTEAECFDSYRKAYDFYKHELGDKPLAIVCNSWLLYPDNVKFFPKHSNILKFMSHFDIISYDTHESFGDAWRVFGKEGLLPPTEWSAKTSLQKAYKDHLLSNGKTGTGFGILLFDGEKIIK